MKEGEYRVCQCCNGKKEFVWDDSSHETCVSEDQDGIYEEGRIHITARAMVKLRRSRWEEQVGWPEEERRYMGHEVLPEDRHGQPVPMVIVGTDVVSLYPIPKPEDKGGDQSCQQGHHEGGREVGGYRLPGSSTVCCLKLD